MFLNMVAKILGFAEKQVIAHCFGAGRTADAYLAATGLSYSAFDFVREIVQSALIPLLFARDSEGRDMQTQARSALLVALLLGCTGAVMIVWLPGLVAHSVAPGVDSRTMAELTSLLRWSAPALPLLCVAGVTYALLNASGHFGLSASGDILAKFVLIGACLTAAFSSFPRAPVLSLGVVAAFAMRLLTQLPSAAKSLRPGNASPARPATSVGPLLTVVIPLGVGAAISQLGELGTNYFSSYLPVGTIAARAYAKKIVDMPIFVLPYVLSVVSFPALSRLSARGEKAAFFSLFGRVVTVTALALAPLAAIMAIYSVPIVRLLLEHGMFSRHASETTSLALRYYAIGIPAFALDVLLTPTFYARLRMWTPTLLGAATVFVKLLIMWMFARRFGLIAVASALTISKGLKVSVLGWALCAWNGIPFSQFAREVLLGYLLPLSFAYLVVSIANRGPFQFDPWGRLNAAYFRSVALNGLLFVATFLGIVGALPSRSASMIRFIVTRRFSRS